MTDHSYHHKYCETCKRYTVHDSGRCITCNEKDEILERLAKNEENEKSDIKQKTDKDSRG